MIGEISIGGVFVPSLLIWGLVAFVLSFGVRRALAFVDFYRFVWHRALFDTAVYVILLGAVVAASSYLLEP